YAAAGCCITAWIDKQYVRDARTVVCSEFFDNPYLCIFYRYWFGYFSSRGIKGCASRCWTKAGACTIDLSSWREHRAGACTGNYRVNSCSIRQFGAVWFTLIAGLAVFFLIYIAKWYATQMTVLTKKVSKKKKQSERDKNISKAVKAALVVLVFIVFARSWYVVAISNFYAFYIIENYGFSIAESQIYIFTFLFMGAVGTFAGGPLADQFGKRNVIIFSLLAAAPLALVLPYVGPLVAIILLAMLGVIVMSSFSVAVVYAQELMPGNIGMVSGLIVGL